MKTIIKFAGVLTAVGLAAGTVLMSCQETDYPDPQPATGPSANQARFLFVNAAPGAPALNFLIENNQAGQARSFGEATGYIASQTGPVQLRARAATGQIGGVIGSSDILFRAGATNQTNFSASANTSYTVFVTDTLNRPRPTTTGGTNPGGPQFLVVTDTLTAPAAGTARVRFFNLAPDVSSASLRLLNPVTNQGAAAFPNRPYRNATGTNLRYTSVPAGTYTVQVYTATAVPASTTAPAAAVAQNVALAEGRIYTLYARGLNRDRSLGVGIVQHN